MSEALKFIENEVDNFNQVLKDTIDSKGLNASGNAKNSIRRQTDEQNQVVYSVGADYIEFLNTGRAPGKFPPVSNMMNWVNIKPVSMQNANGNELSDNSKAFLAGRKISREGTEIYKDKSKGIELSSKVATLRESIAAGLAQYAKADILEELNKFNKERLSKS
ncbi:MAG: hypothetical protein R3250_04610 [Melioribacteraceae bacterium]|nr:hypothetical protein [Melioribacteraceae bacterium]